MMQGQQWGVHVLEGAWAWLLAAVYIAGTVISGHPPFISIANVSCACVVVMLLALRSMLLGHLMPAPPPLGKLNPLKLPPPPPAPPKTLRTLD